MPDLQLTDVRWGACECARKPCSNLAELIYDDEPVCVDCADLMLERHLAVAATPSLRFTLAGLDE